MNISLTRNRMGLLIFGLLTAFLLGACSQPATTPTAVAETENTAVPDTPVPPTETAVATATYTPEPTATNTPTPTVTNTPEPTLTPSATPTPLPTDVPTRIENNGVEMTLARAGFFEMGADARDLLNLCSDFRQGCQFGWFTPSDPAHRIFLYPFYIDVTEVTNGQFIDFLNELGTHEGVCGEEDCFDPDNSRITISDEGEYVVGDALADYPITGATWYGASAFCEWRNGRLPTEAEWELAAGWDPETETKYNFPWGDEFDGSNLNFCDVNCPERQADEEVDDGYILEAPVASYEDGRSPLGAYDMAGNVWEWVRDWYDAGYYDDSPTVDPTGPEEGASKVVRGGSWFDTGNFSHTAVRFPAPPDQSSNSIGFRCVFTP